MPQDTAAAGAARRQLLIGRRKALGLTQEQLAELLEVQTSTVLRWERGETAPRPRLRPKLAKALRVPLEQVETLLASPEPQQPRTAPATVPRQLPSAVPGFTGRSAELTRLTEILDDAAAGTAGTVVISAIGGTPGIGKTALALHWAHQVAPYFPDGQLHANLRGFGPSGVPADPAAVIRTFLDALGVPPQRIPRDPDAQAGLYRSLLAGKRMLIVADNADSEQQVRPLLPASSGSLVIVTSRRQLGGLAAAEGARLIGLDVLTPSEAVQLLSARIGRQRAAGEPDAVEAIARLCACLPLALAVAAARASARPGLPVAALAEELADSAGRLDALDAGDPSASVRAVFSWSYQQLSEAAARMFRLLGMHPGPDISLAAAASLTGTAEPDARRMLGELTRANLIAEHVPGRYACHDLLRAYAADQARRIDSHDDRDAAVGRVLDHYLHTAARAKRLLAPTAEPVELAPPRPGAAAGQPADYAQAMAWFDTELPVLLAAAALAAESGFGAHAWQLPWALADFLPIRGHWLDWAATLRAALTAASRHGDAAAQALSGILLAGACAENGDHEQARRHYERSLALYQQVGSRHGEADVHQGLGLLDLRLGRHGDALAHSEQALHLYQALGDKAYEATALNNVGWCLAQLGDYRRARTCCRRALTLCIETAHRQLKGEVWDSLGYAEHHLGNHAEAAACYQRAVSAARDSGDIFLEATALNHLGDSRHAADDLGHAREAWEQALAMFEDLKHPDAGQVRSKLAEASGVTREVAPGVTEQNG